MNTEKETENPNEMLEMAGKYHSQLQSEPLMTENRESHRRHLTRGHKKTKRGRIVENRERHELQGSQQNDKKSPTWKSPWPGQNRKRTPESRNKEAGSDERREQASAGRCKGRSETG